MCLNRSNWQATRLWPKYLVDAHSVIRVMDRQGKFLHELKLPEYVNVSSMNGESGDNELFYSLTSYTIPSTIYRYDVKSDIVRQCFSNLQLTLIPKTM